MGIRVSFYLGKKDGLKDFFLSNGISELRKYYENLNEFYAHEISSATSDSEKTKLRRDFEMDVNPDVFTFYNLVATEGESALIATSADRALLVDRLMDDFFECMDQAESTIEASSSELYKSHYIKDREEIASACDPRAVHLWDYLLNGRGIGRSNKDFPF